MILEPGVELLTDNNEVLLRLKQYQIYTEAMDAFSANSIDHTIAAAKAKLENKGSMQLFISQLHTKFPGQLDLVITQLYEDFPNAADNGYVMYIIENFKNEEEKTRRYIDDICGDDYEITDTKQIENTKKDIYVNPNTWN